MIKVLAIALLVLLVIRAFARSLAPPKPRPSSNPRESKIYDDGDVSIQKKGNSKNSVEDIDFEEVDD